MVPSHLLTLFCLAIGLSELTLQAVESPRRIAVAVRETAGIRRFGYPVTVIASLPLGAIQTTKQVRLVDANGNPVPAQVTATQKHPDGSVMSLEVDLNLSPGPLETTRLQIEYGDGITAVEPKQGLVFSESAETFQVSAYTIRKDARPLISKVHYGRDYLRTGGIDVTASRGDVEYTLASAKRQWTIEKQGPFQVRLRCDGHYPDQSNSGGLPFSLTLEFVSTKSWIGLRHTLHPVAGSGKPLALGVLGNFQLDGRLLWDTDVNYWLYGVLESSEQMTFSQEQDGWRSRFGKAGLETEYAVSTASDRRSRAWGHFQEARENGNVVAFGIGGSATLGDHSWTVLSDGRLLIRAAATDRQPVRLDAYFHFIPVPAHHTARTSPAAMMSPLEVAVVPN